LENARQATEQRKRSDVLSGQLAREVLRTSLMAEVQAELSQGIAALSGSAESDRAQLSILSAAAEYGISLGSIELLVLFEISGRIVYEKRYQKPVYPGGSSGVTIGIGYDLGRVSANEFKAAWGAHFTPEVLEMLSQYASLTGDQAKDAIPHLANIIIPYDTAVQVFSDQTLPGAVAQTRQVFSNTEDLHPDSFGALVSLVLNRGPSLSADDRRREMRTIAQYMREKKFDAVPAEIRSMKRLLTSPEMAGLRLRREREALQFEQGITKLQDRQAKLSAEGIGATPE
jgi:Bacterial toxin homologue of phage lysozyme, C-term